MSEFEDSEFEDIDLTEIEVDENTGAVTKKPLDLSKGPQDAPKKITGSATGVKTYLQCGAKRYASITKQPMERSAALVNGSAVHESLEMFIKKELDPHRTYDSYMRSECEKNSIPLTGPDAETIVRDGHACVASGVGILSKPVGDNKVPYYKTIDHADVERPFVFHRNGFKFVGSFDLVPRIPGTKRYIIGDFKTSKRGPFRPDPNKTELPSKATYELNTDLQFSIYYKGAFEDETVGSNTKGQYADYLTWIHLRGHGLAYGTNKTGANKGQKGSRRLPLAEQPEGKVQYNVQTFRTPEIVEDQFVTTIDPVLNLMDQGIWIRNEGEHCKSMCSYYDKKNERCAAEIPADHARKLREANEISLLSKSLKEKK